MLGHGPALIVEQDRKGQSVLAHELSGPLGAVLRDGQQAPALAGIGIRQTLQIRGAESAGVALRLPKHNHSRARCAVIPQSMPRACEIE